MTSPSPVGSTKELKNLLKALDKKESEVKAERGKADGAAKNLEATQASLVKAQAELEEAKGESALVESSLGAMERMKASLTTEVAKMKKEIAKEKENKKVALSAQDAVTADVKKGLVAKGKAVDTIAGIHAACEKEQEALALLQSELMDLAEIEAAKIVGNSRKKQLEHLGARETEVRGQVERLNREVADVRQQVSTTRARLADLAVGHARGDPIENGIMSPRVNEEVQEMKQALTQSRSMADLLARQLLVEKTMYRLKVVPVGGGAKTFVIPPDITLSKLQALLSESFSDMMKGAVLKFDDSDGDSVIVRNENDLQAAWHYSYSPPSNVMLHLVPTRRQG